MRRCASFLDDPKVLETQQDAVFVCGSGHMIGHFLDLWNSIAHRDAIAAFLHHLDIVVIIAEAGAFVLRQIQDRQQLADAAAQIL